MPQGGTITVRQLADKTSRTAVLQFEDTGPGIDPLILEKLFEPFVTTRAAGSGLGLAISKRLIEEQGGELKAGNSSRGGALFTIRLPLA